LLELQLDGLAHRNGLVLNQVFGDVNELDPPSERPRLQSQ
jgi:hypothetical protein